jgi:adenylate kinase family enzyme
VNRDPKLAFLLSPPGGGKGTQAKILQRFHGCQHVEMSALLRARRDADQEVRNIMASGGLVGDDIINSIVEGFFANFTMDLTACDGFFRTYLQVVRGTEILWSKGLFDACVTIVMNADSDEVLRRIGKRFDLAVEAIMVETRLSEDFVHEIAQRKRTPQLMDEYPWLSQIRPDDIPSVASDRIALYKEEFEKIKPVMHLLPNVIHVDALDSVENVYQQIGKCMKLGRVAETVSLIKSQVSKAAH